MRIRTRLACASSLETGIQIRLWKSLHKSAAAEILSHNRIKFTEKSHIEPPILSCFSVCFLSGYSLDKQKKPLLLFRFMALIYNGIIRAGVPINKRIRMIFSIIVPFLTRGVKDYHQTGTTNFGGKICYFCACCDKGADNTE